MSSVVFFFNNILLFGIVILSNYYIIVFTKNFTFYLSYLWVFNIIKKQLLLKHRYIKIVNKIN